MYFKGGKNVQAGGRSKMKKYEKYILQNLQ